MSTHDTQALLGNEREGDSHVTNDLDPNDTSRNAAWDSDPTRAHVRRFLTSKAGHYAVLLLVSLDVTCIFADFLISLYICEQWCGKDLDATKPLVQSQEALGIVSLVFSCLFMAELIASVWAFGLKYAFHHITAKLDKTDRCGSYFKSKFHCFDAAVILAGFVIDVCLKGVLEEAGSIVVALRLWRVFKIIEEFSSGAEEEMNALSERAERLKAENDQLKRELMAFKANSSGRGG
ncbi:hypothetical protein MMC07_008763 [Pseudocyphellaria aurata]|nr:hypothetical protein [Pseudocyphellaria aurata]